MLHASWDTYQSKFGKKTTKLNLKIVYTRTLSLGQPKSKIFLWSKVQKVVNLSLYYNRLKFMPNQMTLDEKTCWNPTWIATDIVTYTFGCFKKVGLMKIMIAHKSQKIATIHLWYFIKFIYIWKVKWTIFWWFHPHPPYKIIAIYIYIIIIIIVY
jgi:hypothetical protein